LDDLLFLSSTPSFLWRKSYGLLIQKQCNIYH
jgi:hypothetical protein